MKTAISALMLMASVWNFAQGIKFEKNASFKSVLEKAKKEKKIIFIDAYASWCGPCKMMTKNIFPLKTVGDYYNKNFINLAMDMEKGEGMGIAQKYGVTSYPTYLFVNGNGDLVHKDLGYMEADAFVKAGEEAQNTLKLGSLKERFEKGESSPDFLKKIIKQYYQSDYDLAKKASEKYFAQKSGALDQEELGLLFGFIKNEDDPNFMYVEKHYSEIVKLVPEQSLKNFLTPLRLKAIISKSLNDNKEVNEAYFLEKTIPLLGKIEAENYLNQLKLNLFLEKKQYDRYEKLALNLYQDPEAKNVNDLAAAAKVFALHIKNPVSLKMAQVWAEKSVMVNETAENTYALAKLLFLNGKKQEARDYAKLSKIIAEKQQQNADEIDLLIKELQ